MTYRIFDDHAYSFLEYAYTVEGAQDNKEYDPNKTKGHNKIPIKIDKSI